MTDEIKQKIEKALTKYKYVAIDRNGVVYIFQNEPVAISERGIWIAGTDVKYLGSVGENPYADWQDSLYEIKDGKLVKVEGEE